MDIIQMGRYILLTESLPNNPLLSNFSTRSPVFQRHSTIFRRRHPMKKILFLLLLISLFMSGAAFAQTSAPSPPKVDSGDTAWLLISAALVMLMTPGLALFYGGMVRSKNVLGTIMQSFIALGVITIQWAFFGYSLAFGPDIGHVIGSLKWVGLRGVGLDPFPDYAATVPHQAFMIFQMMFAVITPALITGAFAERLKFKTYLVFLLLWATFVYDPIAHWVWGIGGWIRNLGGLDFAGGLVVHISSGVAALAAALIVGKRKSYGDEAMPPHNLPITLMGAGILWFGWFGFNGGSAIASNSLATSAFVVTQFSAASAALSWMIAEWAFKGNPTVLGAASGAVAGLATITPASGFVGPISAIVIGLVAGGLCYYAVNLKSKFGYDDSLDVVGVHGVGSTWGILATGLFASKAINAAGNNGLFFGNPSLLGIQAIGIVSVWVYSFLVTLIILKVLDWTMGLRVSDEHEITGLDLSQHGEAGYSII
jgi:Amt family ammonium transporter